MNEMLETILNRRSIRRFKEEPITEEELHLILEAGMCAPTAANTRDWCFLVVRDKETLAKMADASGRAAQPLKGASVGVLLCGDLERAIRQAPEYWVVDGAIAGENMVLAASALGIGSVWIGTWPQEEKVNAQKELFHLPDHVTPHSMFAFGYPDETPAKKPGYEEDRVHFEKW